MNKYTPLRLAQKQGNYKGNAAENLYHILVSITLDKWAVTPEQRDEAGLVEVSSNYNLQGFDEPCTVYYHLPSQTALKVVAKHFGGANRPYMEIYGENKEIARKSLEKLVGLKGLELREVSEEEFNKEF